MPLGMRAWEPGLPGPKDRLAGTPGGRVVRAVEVQPQEDLASPPGRGVQHLHAGSHPGQRRVGAGPAGEGAQVAGLVEARQTGRAVPVGCLSTPTLPHLSLLNRDPHPREDSLLGNMADLVPTATSQRGWTPPRGNPMGMASYCLSHAPRMKRLPNSGTIVALWGGAK